MKVGVVCVGRAKGPIGEAIAEYESRAARYYSFESVEVKETPHRAQPPAKVLEEEGERILARVPSDHELVGLHRPGKLWSSEDLSRHLGEAALHARAGVTFVIGGAYGLSPAVLERADRLMSLSSMTLPHEIARLLLTEQIYRAGTIARGEPYHKGPLVG